MQSLTPQTPIRSWAVMSRLDGGQRWKIEHAENPSVKTLAELAAWGRPKQGQWRGFGKTKIAAWTSILAEAGLEWRGMAPVYPRGNPMYSSITPLTEEPDDIVYRLQVAIDNDWHGRLPLTQRDIIADAIREIRGLRSGQDALMDEVEIGRQAMNVARSELAAEGATTASLLRIIALIREAGGFTREDLDALPGAVKAMRDQRDEARREICYDEMTRRYETGHAVATEQGIAAERGWDCFAQQEGGGA